MSFEIYVQRFKAGKAAGFARSDVEAVLGSRMRPAAGDTRFIELVYSAGVGGTLQMDSTDEISSLSVGRPGVEELFDDLFILMRRIGAVLYWPDEKPSMVVADAEIRAELPESMVDALGPGLLVRSGGDIIAAIKRKD